jgi:hypothetical protein
VTSVVTSLAVWRFYVNWQFHQSTAGYRLNDVIEATRLLLGSNGDAAATEAVLSTRYRNSLGPVLQQLFRAFGSGPSGCPGSQPLFDGPEAGRIWEMYDAHVRPVITDINNNSFIGWLPGIPNIRRLLALQRLCFQIERALGAAQLVSNTEQHEREQAVADLREASRKLRDCWETWVAAVAGM